MTASGRPSRRATRSHTTLALVLRRTAYGEADWVLSLFTERLGQIAALARSARRSQRRFSGSLEPFHTLELAVDETPGSDLAKLREARVVQPRTELLAELSAMQAAGTFLGWVRHAAPAHTPEPEIWELSLACLDELERGAALRRTEVAPSARAALAVHGLRLLVACGWRLELEYCVETGVRCPDGKAARIDPARGGLVSSARGTGGILVNGAQRRRLIGAQAGRDGVLETEDIDLAIELVERSLQAHAGLAT
ncbi:MAG TPA: DNA repair protein RecO [Polyangiaceae bacterium]|nr:DNA repair protein RecO [Polyangiaceae bacterium]